MRGLSSMEIERERTEGVDGIMSIRYSVVEEYAHGSPKMLDYSTSLLPSSTGPFGPCHTCSCNSGEPLLLVAGDHNPDLETAECDNVHELGMKVSSLCPCSS